MIGDALKTETACPGRRDCGIIQRVEAIKERKDAIK